MARYNKNFAKSEDGIVLVFAPGEFDFCGVRYNAVNDERIYAQMGYYRYCETEKPSAKEGVEFVPYYETANGCVTQKWRETEKEKTVTEEEIIAAIEEGVNRIDC